MMPKSIELIRNPPTGPVHAVAYQSTKPRNSNSSQIPAVIDSTAKPLRSPRVRGNSGRTLHVCMASLLSESCAARLFNSYRSFGDCQLVAHSVGYAADRLTEDQMTTRSRRRATALTQVRALAHPLRLRLIELFASGPLTAKQAAQKLGQPPTRLYHHVATLERA